MTDFTEPADLAITNEGGKVVLRVTAEGVTVGGAYDPETACQIATDVVRQANAAGSVDVVSIYMPRADWDALATAAAVGMDRDDALDAAAQPLKVVNAVLAWTPETDD